MPSAANPWDYHPIRKQPMEPVENEAPGEQGMLFNVDRRGVVVSRACHNSRETPLWTTAHPADFCGLVSQLRTRIEALVALRYTTIDGLGRALSCLRIRRWGFESLGRAQPPRAISVVQSRRTLRISPDTNTGEASRWCPVAHRGGSRELPVSRSGLRGDGCNPSAPPSVRAFVHAREVWTQAL